jgi:alkanesulfonate monooxygenase SsuD/methylene tetrahydromethanopterin reductase-like flavin-dependent oxidoreductase (luciferase family)
VASRGGGDAQAKKDYEVAVDVAKMAEDRVNFLLAKAADAPRELARGQNGLPTESAPTRAPSRRTRRTRSHRDCGMITSMDPRLGVIYRPTFAPTGLRAAATAAEAAGVDELWLWEDCFQQGGIAQVAVALAATERLSVGVGLVPAPLRNVAAAAMEFATLEAMFPGRVRIAVGHGVQSWMRQAGAAVASPMTLLREYVTALHALLAGDTVTVDGRYVQLSEVQLEFPPQQRLPILIGGTGPKTLQLAGEIADGVIIDSRYSNTTVLEALGHVGTGRAAADGRPFSTVMFLVCVPGDDTHRLLAEEASRLEVPDDGVFGVTGTADEIAAALGPYRDAGVDTIALQPIGGQDEVPAFITVAGDVHRKSLRIN